MDKTYITVERKKHRTIYRMWFLGGVPRLEGGTWVASNSGVTEIDPGMLDTETLRALRDDEPTAVRLTIRVADKQQ